MNPPPFESEYPNMPDRFSLNGDVPAVPAKAGNHWNDVEKEKVVWQRLMEAFFAGRSKCRIRKTKTPIVYCDFMPDVFSIGG
ncbi:MAG: hypothetical protein M1330_03870 [Armatimonadetes bacterium]|nr:hypothetical protein [Armatimonadota bacterium]